MLCQPHHSGHERARGRPVRRHHAGAGRADQYLGCDGLHSDCVGALSVSAVPNLATVCVAQLTGDAISGLTSVQVPALPLAFIGAIATGAPCRASSQTSSRRSRRRSLTRLATSSSPTWSASSSPRSRPPCASSCRRSRRRSSRQQSCSSLDESCTLAIQSWSGFRGGCVATFPLSLLRNASDAQLLSLSNAGWGGMTVDQYQYSDRRARQARVWSVGLGARLRQARRHRRGVAVRARQQL
jgi:hypothetical protein